MRREGVLVPVLGQTSEHGEARDVAFETLALAVSSRLIRLPRPRCVRLIARWPLPRRRDRAIDEGVQRVPERATVAAVLQRDRLLGSLRRQKLNSPSTVGREPPRLQQLV